MIRALLLHDRLAPPKNYNVYLEVIDPQLHGGCLKVFDSQKREDRYIEIEHVLADIHAGKLTVLRAGKPRYSLAAQSEDQELHERNQVVRELMRRIHETQKRQGISFLQAYRIAAEEYQQKATPQSPPFPPLSTMYRYQKSEMAGLPILRGNKNKGNRLPRYPQEVVNMIRIIAERYFLLPHSRWTLKRVTDYLNRELHGTVLPATSPPISNKYVKRIIMHLVSADPEHDRMLPKDAVAGKSFAKKRIRAEAPFERVEQDALHLPFVIQTPGGVTSQVHLVHAIDCCTSYPLGWCMVIGAPVEADSLACVEMYMSPLKKKRFEELGIDHDMNVCGTPGQLVVDNGAEVTGTRISNLNKLGVDTKHCRARAGQEKPFMERLNRSVKEAIEGLPGCTRLDGKDGMRDPIALGDKLMTLNELEHWIVRWYYEKWIHTPLERLRWDVVLTSSLEGDTPAERWKHFEATCFAVSLPPSRAEWLAALYEHTERKLSRKTGITIDGLHYKGDEIETLIGKYGEQRPLHVLFNPDDFRHIYIYEGDDLPLATLKHEHLRPETPAWSFNEAKERFKNHKSTFKSAPQAGKFDRDMDQQVIAESLPAKKKKQSKYDRNRETARREKEARAVDRASKNPVPLPPRVTGKSDPVSETTSPTALLANAMLGAADLYAVIDRDSGDLI
jgi:putative transposase